jgi:glutamate synthase domain-containing protein 2
LISGFDGGTGAALTSLQRIPWELGLESTANFNSK